MSSLCTFGDRARRVLQRCPSSCTLPDLPLGKAGASKDSLLAVVAACARRARQRTRIVCARAVGATKRWADKHLVLGRSPVSVTLQPPPPRPAPPPKHRHARRALRSGHPAGVGTLADVSLPTPGKTAPCGDVTPGLLYLKCPDYTSWCALITIAVPPRRRRSKTGPLCSKVCFLFQQLRQCGRRFRTASWRWCGREAKNS